MNKFLINFIVFVILAVTPLFASQKETTNIAQISAVSLYNIDKVSLNATIRAYVKHNPNIQALKIIEALSGEIYVEFYKKKGKIVHNTIFPKDVSAYQKYNAISKYENEEVGQIIAYFENKDLIPLNDTEKKWLSNNKIVLSVDDSYAPMNFKNKQNKMDGLSIDYIKLIEKKIGHSIELNATTWPIALDNAMKHKTDGIINANLTSQRAEKLIFTNPYITVPMALITSNKSQSYANLSEMNTETILVKEKTVEASTLPKKYPNLIIKEVKNYQESLQLVSSGKADGVFGHLAVLEYEMNEYMLPDLKKNFITFNEFITEQAIGIRKNAPVLRNILNKAISSISKKEKRVLSVKWMGNAVSSSTKLESDEVKWIKQNPVISIAVVNNYPPYDFQDDQNRLIGFHSDMINLINKNLSSNIVLKPFASWKDAYNAAAKGDVHSILSLSWSEERENKYFIYSSPYHFSPYHLVVKKDNTNISSLKSLSNKKIAVEKNTIFIDVLEEKVPTADRVYVNNTKEAYDSVLNGTTLATISPNINDKLFKQSGLKIASEIFHKSSNLYIGTNKMYPTVASILKKGIDSISLKQMSKLKQKWLTKNSSTIELNEKEKKWITNNPTVKMIEFFDEPPYTLNGKTKSGYIYELMEYLIQSAGLSIEYVNGFNSYGDMLGSLEKGEVDVLSTFPTSLNLGTNSNIVKSKSVLKTPFVIIGSANERKITSIKDLYGQKVAVVKGYVQDKYLSKFPKIKKVYVSNNDEGFATIRNGKAKYYVNNRANTEFILNKSFFTDLQIIYELPYTKFPPLSISFAVNGEKDVLVSILNKALEQIPYKKIKNIRDKWILQTDSTKVKEVLFSAKEKEWLVDNPAIRLAYMDYWPVDNNGDNIHTEYVGLLSKYGNINVTLVKYNTWKKGFQDTKKGQNSFGILNLSWSKEREKNSFNYTQPYFFTPGYIVVKQDNKSIQSLENLVNKSVFVKENAITNQIIKEVKYNITPINLKNEESMYKALSQETSKAEALLSYVYNPALLDKYDLKVANKFFSKFGEVHVGISKNQKELFSIINKIYNVIPKNELSRIQNKVYKKTKKIKVELTKDEKSFIKKHSTIKVHNEKNWPPFNFYEFGQPKGYSVELMKLVSQNTGLNLEFVTGPTWDGFLQMMKKSELDVIINIVKNDERSEYMSFTDPFMRATMGIAVHNDNKSIKTFTQMLDKKVALENGFFYHDYFKKNHANTELHVVDDGVQTLQSVSFKNADATIGFVPVMKYIAQKNFITDLNYFTDTSSPVMKPMPLRFSTRKDNPLLLSILQKGLASVTPEQQKALNERWLGESSRDSKIKINLTTQEKIWLKKQNEIQVGIQLNWAPLSYLENNLPQGLSVDYLNLINESLDQKIKIVADTFTNNLLKIKNGTLDAMVDITPNKQRKKIYNFTSNYANIPHYIVSTNENKEYYQSIKDLKGKIVAVEKGYGIIKLLQEAVPTVQLKYYDNTSDALEALSDNKVQAYVGNRAVVNYYVEKNFIPNLKFHGKSNISRSLLSIATTKDKKILRDIIEKVLSAISNKEKKALYENYVRTSEDKKIKLSKKEQAWVNKKRPIKYVFDSDWSPFEWKNELGEHTGIIYDLLSEISERTGLLFEAVPTDTWGEAVNLAETKQADMYGGLGENEDRKKYMNFTKNTLYKTPYVFVVHENNKKDYFDTFNSLSKDERLSVVDGYTIHGIMKDKRPNVKLSTAPNVMEAFRQVEENMVDILIVNAATAKYYINRKGFNTLKIATKTEYNLEIKPAIRKDWPPEVLSIIEKAIGSISQKELADIYHKWTELLVEEKTDWVFIYKIGGGVLLVIFFILYWNRRLHKKVEEKTSELTILLNSFDENVIASKTDTKGIINYASEAFCRVSGYTREELIGSPQNIVRHPDTPKSLFKGLWKTIQSGKVWRGEVKNRTKDGDFYWVDVVITPEFNPDGEPIGYSAIRQDITAQKEVENKTEILDKQKKELELMLEIFDEHIISSKSDLEGHIIAASKAFSDITEYSVDELIGLPHSAVRHPDMPAEIFEDLWKTIQSGKIWRGEIKNKTKSGGFYWVDVIVSPEFDHNQNITGYSAIRQDITSKKEVEELSTNLEIKVEERTLELKESQEQFSSMASNVPGVIYRCRVDADWTMLYISEEIETLSGYPISDYLNNSVRTFADIMHPDDIPPVAKLIQNQIDKGEKFLVDYRVISKEGDEKWVRSQGQAFKDDNGEFFLDGVLFDVTEQRALEQEAKDAQEKIAQNKLFVDTLLDSQEQIVITTDGKVLRSCNKAFLEFFTLENIEEFTQDYDCICDKFVLDETDTYLQKQMGELTWIEYILEHDNQAHKAVIKKDGVERIFTVTAAVMPIEEGNIRSAVFTDITEVEIQKKQTESVLSSMLLPILITDKKTRQIIYANPYAEKQYETTIDDLLGLDIEDLYTYEGQRDDILMEMATQGVIQNFETKFRTLQNNEFNAILSLIDINYGGKDCFLGVASDITQQKEAEKEILEVNKKVSDSIEYASLIQHALIPQTSEIKKYFDDYFTIWQPKDVVGGDIYLFEELRNENECLLMVIDCTGHGVPGAFVTMLVKAIERQVIADIMTSDKEVSPAKILEYFNVTMKKLLRQESDDSISNAGFDGGILYYNRKENYIKYSGAETPLFYIQDNELSVVKGNRHSIGYKKSDPKYEFDEYRIDIDKETHFYLSTDGYFDQNGGNKGFPFGKKRFKEFIETNNTSSLNYQKELLFQVMQEYQQEEETNDDMTVIGFKISKTEEGNDNKKDNTWVI